MKFYIKRSLRFSALAGLVSITVLASAGCTRALESAMSSPLPVAQDPPVQTAAGDDIRALTQRVKWATVDVTPVIQGF